MVPTAGQEVAVVQAHGEGVAAIEHPGPLHSFVKFCGEVGDLGVAEVCPRGENTAEQDAGIDAGNLGIGRRLAGVDVVEVPEEAVAVRKLVEMEVERGADALDYSVVRQVAAVIGDAEGGKAEAGSGDAGKRVAGTELAGGVVCVGTVEDLTVGRIGLLPEEERSATFHVVEEGVVGGGEAASGLSVGGEGCGCGRSCEKMQDGAAG